MTGSDSDRTLGAALERLLPSLDGVAEEWKDVLARAGWSADARPPSPTACRSGRTGQPSLELGRPAPGRRPRSPASERRRDNPPPRHGVSPAGQGWGTRPIDHYSGVHGLALLPEALGWGTRPI